MPGFFENYKDEGGLSYIDAEEKAALIKGAVPFTILRVFTGEGTYGPRYTAVIELEGEQRGISFGAGKVQSRDSFFDAVLEYLDQDEEQEPIVVKLKKAGQAVLVVNAEDE
jgi:hypothetical protein